MSEQLLASIAACAPFDADLEGTPLGEWIDEHGVNIDAQQATPHNDTLLMWAVRNGNPDAVVALVDAGADLGTGTDLASLVATACFARTTRDPSKRCACVVTPRLFEADVGGSESRSKSFDGMPTCPAKCMAHVGRAAERMFTAETDGSTSRVEWLLNRLESARFGAISYERGGHRDPIKFDAEKRESYKTAMAGKAFEQFEPCGA